MQSLGKCEIFSLFVWVLCDDSFSLHSIFPLISGDERDRRHDRSRQQGDQQYWNVSTHSVRREFSLVIKSALIKSAFSWRETQCDGSWSAEKDTAGGCINYISQLPSLNRIPTQCILSS